MFNPTKFIDNRQYHKRNYDQAVKHIIPKLYYEQDYAENDKKIDILDQVINSHLNVIGNIKSIIDISAVSVGLFSSINTPEGIAPFFIKQNKLTDIDLNDFDRKILVPLGRSVRDFATSSQFYDYLENTLLPGIRLNKPTLDFLEGGAASANHEYLITNLSWLYFLNLSSASLTYNPSGYVRDLIANNLFNNNSEILLSDAMKGLSEYIWRNYAASANFRNAKLLPNDLRPPQYTVSNSYTDGDQQLDRLKTLVEIVYSPLHIDSGDTRLVDAISDYLNNGYTITEKSLDGPFIKLIKAIGFGFADYSNDIDNLELLNDIENCPDEYLPHLAKLIGWPLFGSEPDKWRLQIANAVSVYKSVGTKKAIQFAADAVFSQDIFDVSSRVYELWESYVPHLIYYALATESTYLKDFDSWNKAYAAGINAANTGTGENIFGWVYNPSSMDANIRLCTDQIIYNLVLEFSNSFKVGGKPFPVGTSSFVFNYRDRDFAIPPFEEYPYYVATHLDDNMIDAIVDWLVCFGVPEDFAFKVGDYIRKNTVLAQDDLRLDNSWLMLMPSAEYAPNWDTVIQDISNKRSDYLPLWCGKSSHFKTIFEANEFDFIKNSLEVESKEALKIASQIVNEFSPTHSIPLVLATISATDNYDTSDLNFPYLSIDKQDQSRLNVASSVSYAGFGMSALAMPSYKRGIASSLPTFQRSDVDSLADGLVSFSSTAANLPRRNHRRRDFRFTLPKDGFYTKDGFNTPSPLGSYSSAYYPASNTFLPLGLIPSAQSYVSISNYHDIPPIYYYCENLNSQNIYSGLVVSNTFPVRGWRGVESNRKMSELGSRPDYYWDLGQLHPVIAVMHYIKEVAKVYEASSYYYYNDMTTLKGNSKWKNLLQSYANNSTEYSGNFPNSNNDYLKFGFGREIHKLYNDYTHNFIRHRTVKNILNLDGPTIFGHTFGSVIKNSKFTDNGTLTNLHPYLITSSLNNTVSFSNGNAPFKDGYTGSGTYTADSLNSLYVGSYEYRNSGILDHIEFCQTSGSSKSNEFTVFRLNKSNKNPNRLSDLAYENTLIRQRSINGFGRLRFDISKYQTNTLDGFDVPYNFLTPEHDFTLDLKVLTSNSDGIYFGGKTIGIWIHTKEELGSVWSYTKDKKWVQHSADLSIQDVLDNSHLFNIPKYKKEINRKKFRCLKNLINNNPNKYNDVIASFTESDFKDIQLKFTTKNKDCLDGPGAILPPSDYYENISQQVHRLNQNYIIEIFTLAESTLDSFTLYHKLNLVDQTLNTWSKPLVGGITNGSLMGDIYCKEFRVDLSRDQLLTIIKYFNELAGTYNTKFGYGSRVASYTSGVYEANGGSRINYVESPDWNVKTYTTSGNVLHTLNLIN